MQLDSPSSKILYAVVRMEVSGPKLSGVATAFVFSHEWRGGSAPFLVTAKHSVADAKKGRLFFTLKEGEGPKIGQHACLEMEDFVQLWHPHPNPEIDLAVTPLAPLAAQLQQAGKEIFHTALDATLVPAGERAAEVAAAEDVLVYGYAAELQDPTHLIPLVRRGATASPYAIDFGGAPKFLVQAPILPGMAGSPVFLARTVHQATPQGIVASSQWMLLGVLCEVAVHQFPGRAAFLAIPPAPSPAMADLAWMQAGLVARSPAIGEAVSDFLKRFEAAEATAPPAK